MLSCSLLLMANLANHDTDAAGPAVDASRSWREMESCGGIRCLEMMRISPRHTICALENIGYITPIIIIMLPINAIDHYTNIACHAASSVHLT
jgi:hypothetical protein